MPFAFTPLTWPLLASAGVTLALGVYAIRRRSVRGAPAFAATMLAGACWSFTHAVETAAVGFPPSSSGRI